MVLGHTVVLAVQKEVQHKFVVPFGARIRSTIIIGYEILAYDSVGLPFVLNVTEGTVVFTSLQALSLALNWLEALVNNYKF